jgi:hypothetical protein
MKTVARAVSKPAQLVASLFGRPARLHSLLRPGVSTNDVPSSYIIETLFNTSILTSYTMANPYPYLAQRHLLLIFLAYNVLSVHCLSTLSQPKKITSEFLVVIDGAEWTSIQRCLPVPPRTGGSAGSEVGCLSVVCLETKDKDRLVGLRAPSASAQGVVMYEDDLFLYEDSIARVPSKVSDAVVVSTLVHALGHIHCVIPCIDAVGGDETTLTRSGSVAILGGKEERAVQAAIGLASLGIDVTLISNSNVPQVEKHGVKVMSTAVGDDEVGFCDSLKQFDALLDTLGDEYGDDDILGSGTTIRLLKQRHGCETYISTLNQAQVMIEKKGLIFGPGKAQKHTDSMRVSLQQHGFAPPKWFGTTLQDLLAKNVLYTGKLLQQNKNKVWARGWSLSEYWETATWPRDSSGINVRYGLPVLDEDDFQEEAETVEEEEEEDVSTTVDSDNPYVLEIIGVNGLQKEIIDAQQDCVLYLTANFCRTCRTLAPKYQRLARLGTEQPDNTVLYAKADTSGNIGKGLGKCLGVDAVPAFVFFRKGRCFGKTLKIARLPDKKLDLAVDFLRQGLEWDDEALRNVESEQQS